MKPTYADLTRMQRSHNQYMYDHTYPTQTEVDRFYLMYTVAGTAEGFLRAIAYGERHGVCWWDPISQDLKQGPKRIWHDV